MKGLLAEQGGGFYSFGSTAIETSTTPSSSMYVHRLSTGTLRTYYATVSMLLPLQ